MHLLAAQRGNLHEAEDPLDLRQSGGDIIFLSAADSDLALLSAARARAAAMGEALPSLRFASLSQLSHPMSVDLYAEKTLRHAKLVLARLIGGEAYWRYGAQVLAQAAEQYGFALSFLPMGGAEEDSLRRLSTLPPEDGCLLAEYLQHSGSENALNFLLYCRFLLQSGEKPLPPRALPRAGPWSAPQSAATGKAGKNIYLVFYRAYAQSGQTKAIEALIKTFAARKMQVIPVYISGLKDAFSQKFLERQFAQTPPDLVLNATGFAAGGREGTILDRYGNIVLQLIFSAQTEAGWRRDGRGLAARDVAMQVALPEMDGRILSRAVSFKTAAFYDEATECNIIGHQPLADRVEFTADLAQNWLKLRDKPTAKRRIGLIIANYPGGDGRLGHGVGLDTPQSLIVILRAMRQAGYAIENIPPNGNALMRALAAGVTHEDISGRAVRVFLPLAAYQSYFAALPAAAQAAVKAQWGGPAEDSFCIRREGGLGFALPVMLFGATAVGLQPERAYGRDPRAVYHDPDIVPTHHYLAFYFWLRFVYQADALAHIGKHGNLEWLPGKALALSAECWPEAVLGPLPHIYPFIVNDPGEGTQAKRRAAAVIIDHMTPPLTRAETYGALRDLEVLIDEYYAAAQMDSRRLSPLAGQIQALAAAAGLHEDAGIDADDDEARALEKLDAFLCELKELQIRDGLHIFGQAPAAEQMPALLAAYARLPRHAGRGGGSLNKALAQDLGLEFDPAGLTPQQRAELWAAAKPAALAAVSAAPWRSCADTAERLELLALQMLAGEKACPPEWRETSAVLESLNAELLPYLKSCGADEINGLLNALDGRFTPAGASGAPSRGRLDVFPMGRNFYALDNRIVPTQTAWELGRASAELMVRRYVQDHGEWPQSFGLTCWGTANMRTGGDDIAQALALIGAKPLWDNGSRRVCGYEIIPLAKLGRPRVDVLLRVSGLFRDAFPEQLALLAAAMRAVGALAESAADNPIAAQMQADKAEWLAAGFSAAEAELYGQSRIFGAQPGHYGTGVQELITSGAWESRADLGAAWLEFSAHIYGVQGDVEAAALKGKQKAKAALAKRLGEIAAVVQNQDNREHDILDSGEYFAFEGGMAAAAEQKQGKRPVIYHNDLSNPQRPLIKTLEEELALSLRGRALNPKWLQSAVRHGYKGAAEMAAVVDYVFAFAATTGAVKDAHFDALYAAYLQDETMRRFLTEINPAALHEIALKLSEALRRNLWKPRLNSAAADLSALAKGG